METFYSLERHCYDNVCHCDWRLTIYDCVESDTARMIYVINIFISALVSIMGIGLLFHRIVIKGHTFMEINPKKGFLRPKPIDSMMLFLTTFNILRLINSVILVTNAVPDNMIFRSYIFEVPWECGLWSFTLYMIGIAQTLAESHKSISNSWLPSPRVVDVLSFALLISLITSNTTLSLMAGALAKTNIRVSSICVRLQYSFWVVYILCVTVSVLYCGSRLVQTLQNHLLKFSTTGERYKKLKTGIFKIRAIIGLLTTCLISFGVMLLIYGCLRDLIIKNYWGNMTVCAIWNLLAPVTTLFVEASIIFDPTVDKPKTIAINSSDAEQTSTVFETQNAIKLNGGVDMSFNDTLTNSALDNLNLKYKDALNKHNFSAALHSNNNRQYLTEPDGFYMEDPETQNESFELQRNNSRIQLMDKKY